MIPRLKASMTVSDRFEENTGNLVNLSQLLKSPDSLSEEWLNCMIKQGAPITWREAAEKFLKCLGSIRTEAQVL